MTWLEKFYADNPSRLGASPHSIGCPTDYYARTDCPKETDGSTMTCVRCWNREMPEIPEEKEKENEPAMELKIKDSASLNMIVEALTRNGYHLEIATKWKEWPQNGIDYFCVLVKEREEV